MPLIARVMDLADIEFDTLDRIAVTTGPGSFTGLRVGISATRGIALAAALFTIPEVTGVFFGHDFIAVTKRDGEWQHLKPAILGAIMEHFMSGAPIVAEDAAPTAEGSEEFYQAEDADTVATIKELIETRVRPAVAGDGGDITFRGFRDGVVYLAMKGACSGCPSSTATLRHGIQNLLRHFLPDVREVQSV